MALKLVEKHIPDPVEDDVMHYFPEVQEGRHIIAVWCFCNPLIDISHRAERGYTLYRHKPWGKFLDDLNVPYEPIGDDYK